MNDAHQPQPEVPQLRTLLLTDLCDSVALVERLGDANAAELFKLHDSLVLELQQRWRGRLIDRSDGLLLLFERPIDGLGFALDYSRGLHALGAQRKLELKVRAGLHVGEVLTWRNSDAAVQVGAKPLEVEGLAKPTAARLMTLARPGQILLSAVAESLTHRAARELGERGERLLWKSHGRWRFKGVPTPQEIYEVGEIGNTPLRAPKPTPKAWRDIPLWRRPAALVAEAMLTLTVVAALLFFGRPEPAIAFAERDWIVVGDLRNLTGNATLDASLDQAFRISLEQSRYVNLLSDLKVRDTLGRMKRSPDSKIDRALASEIALRDGARAVILPTVAEVGGRIRVTVEVVDPATQATVYTETQTGRGLESVLASVDTVSGQLRRQLGEAIQSVDQASKPLPQVTTSNLDALRSYALGMEATATGSWKQAEQNFRVAIELDPQFALAYIGIARVLAATSDRAAAVPYLQKAQEYAARLPARDRLYLAAWADELKDSPAALGGWQQLVHLYPDSFAGHGNAFWHLFQANRFADALPHAVAADTAQDPYRSIAIDDIGRIYLVQGKLEQAKAQFTQIALQDKSGPGRRLANVLALQGNYAEAEARLRAIPKSDYANDDMVPRLDLIALKVDQGKWDEVAAELDDALKASRAANDFTQAQFGFLQLSIQALTQQSGKVLPRLRQWQNAQLQRQERALPGEPYASDRAALILAAAYLAQRLGDDALSVRALKVAGPWVEVSADPALGKLLRIVQAGQYRLRGDYAQALALLAPREDDLLQARVALYHTLRAAGEHRQALAQADWIGAHRGLAYGEASVSQSLQTLNVADTRMADRWAAQALSDLDRTPDARRRLDALFAAWPSAAMPAYLRETVEATLPASKQKMT
ncbi:putative peptide modification system cyclase [Xanthomonas sp. NCPPB 2654]|uniref:putative peptide modification system cyclase n=1 Tax=unclassified Xanthomonas TaxID=2643310 RepID=UPI0021DFC35E|nr:MULTISPECIES: putative peptide modification system cyclase [unclassified Xanthomonas]MDL5364243.1 putative peptide modification system cyclase [Xanthomonas sp. NCPPB 2654]UYC20458.1 putative peptide modification system cyclase [Xanthomonas sp. CFBP 8443]